MQHIGHEIVEDNVTQGEHLPCFLKDLAEESLLHLTISRTNIICELN